MHPFCNFMAFLSVRTDQQANRIPNGAHEQDRTQLDEEHGTTPCAE